MSTFQEMVDSASKTAQVAFQTAADTAQETYQTVLKMARPPLNRAKTYSKKAIHFGGGNIGRGFVAEFLHNSGYEVIFVDVVDEIIQQFNRRNSYTVVEMGTEGDQVVEIDHFRAINSKTHEDDVIDEISKANLVTCAVGPNVLRFIAPVIAKGIDKRSEEQNPLHVIACENMIGATDTLKGYIVPKLTETSETELHSKARFANSAVDRIVPQQDPGAGLDVKLEKFYEWCVDQTPFLDAKGGIPPIQGVHFVDNLEPYIERKLFTVNTGHATAAYYGHNRGKRTIHDAMTDPEIRKIVHDVLYETAQLIIDKHTISKEEQYAYVEKIIVRISNPNLEDVVERVGRAPMRKLGRKERFIGPASQLAEKGEKHSALLGAIEVTLKFQNVEGDEESRELAKILREHDAAEATEKITGLEKNHPLFKEVEELVKKVQSEKKSS